MSANKRHSMDAFWQLSHYLSWGKKMSEKHCAEWGKKFQLQFVDAKCANGFFFTSFNWRLALNRLFDSCCEWRSELWCLMCEYLWYHWHSVGIPIVLMWFSSFKFSLEFQISPQETESSPRLHSLIWQRQLHSLTDYSFRSISIAINQVFSHFKLFLLFFLLSVLRIGGASVWLKNLFDFVTTFVSNKYTNFFSVNPLLKLSAEINVLSRYFPPALSDKSIVQFGGFGLEKSSA